MDILRQYQRAVERQLDAGPGPPLLLSHFLVLRERRRAGSFRGSDTRRPSIRYFPAITIRDRLRIDAVLLLEDARGERLHRVVVQHRDRRLQDDRAGVQILVHEVHRAAR